MSKWFNNFLQKHIDNSARNPDSHLSVLSAPPKGFLDGNLENLPKAPTDRTDRADRADKIMGKNFLSVLSAVSSPLKDFSDKNLENLPKVSTDRTDKPNLSLDLSVLSVPPKEFLDGNLKNLPEAPTDRADKIMSENFLSVLSVVSSPLENFPDKSLENLPKVPTDRTDRTDKSLTEKFSVDELHALQKKSERRTELAHAFEERIAIAEYDGQQNILQAQRIAYHDAFIVALTAIPYETAHQGNWFSQHIKESQAWLTSQGIGQPE